MNTYQPNNISNSNSHEIAKQIVDISNLVWGELFESDWESAQPKCPQGWRLPTVQELYTAYIHKVSGFQSNYYWSSSTYAQGTNYAWLVDFDDGGVLVSGYRASIYVRCVKEKTMKNLNYKWQVGWFTTDGNYYRIAIFKNKPSNKTINRLSNEWKIPLDRIQAQVIQ